jgi:uncharacterized iron-regulated membrane protein
MQSLNKTLQQGLRKVHLWLGLIAGLFIVMMGLSGLIIVFRPDIESAAAPHVTSPVVNLPLIERSVASIYPGARVSRVLLPESPTSPVLVQAENKDKQRLQEFFDGSSGQPLGRKQKLAWLDWIVDLHQNLLMGKTGRRLTGVIGAALLLLSISGLASWLSGNRDWKRALAVPGKGPWRRVNYHAHKWAGLWANLLLVAVSFTGIVLAYPDMFQNKIPSMAPETSPGSTKLLALDEYVRAAIASVPGSMVRELRLPTRGRPGVSVAMWSPGDIRPKGHMVVLLDPSSARVLSVETSSGFVDLANAIHKTELGGLPVKLPWSLLGLVPLFLFASGLQIWWNLRTAASGSKRNARAQDLAATLVHK